MRRLKCFSFTTCRRNLKTQQSLAGKLELALSHHYHWEDIEDITWPRVDMNFIFEWSTRYLTSERSERVRYRVEHEKIKFISISRHVIFCLLHKHTYDDVIDYFPKISDHFPEISEDFPKFVRRPDKRFRTFSERFPKITEDCRRLPKIVEEEPMMFRSYSKTSGYFLRDYVAKAIVIMLSSRVKIYMLFTGREVRMGKNCARGLEYGPRPKAEGRTQDEV